MIRVVLKRRKGGGARVKRRARRPIGLVLLNGWQCRARHRGRRGVVLGLRGSVRGDGRLRRRVVVGRRDGWWARVCGRWARWRASIRRLPRMGRIHNADGRAMRSRCQGRPGAMIRRLLQLHRESLGGRCLSSGSGHDCAKLASTEQTQLACAPVRRQECNTYFLCQ